MLEGEYLELVNDLKIKFDEKDREVSRTREINKELKKIILSVYGFIRVMDHTTSNVDLELMELIETLRAYLSDVYDDLFDL